ncbi:MAG: GNAT family N-acetyltransferase [Candidatus Micrarchaeia archaeon]
MCYYFIYKIQLIVCDGYRKRGIGKSLVFRAINYLKKHSTVIVVTTDPNMKAATAFYKSIGFKVSREWFYYKV